MATLVGLLKVDDGRLYAQSAIWTAIQIRYDTYVGRDTVVPNDDSVGLPLDASLVVDALVDVVVEEVEDGV